MLALALGGRSIAEWRALMPEDEWLRWIEFYRQSPFDDYHRFYRPAAHIARALAGGEIDDHLAWLDRRPLASAEGFSAADVATMKAFRKKPKG